MKLIINGKRTRVKMFGKPQPGRYIVYPAKVTMKQKPVSDKVPTFDSKVVHSKKSMKLGEVIKKIRTLRGITQKDLGLALGFNEDTADVRVSQYESGVRKPKEDTFKKIQECLNCKIELTTYVEYSLFESSNDSIGGI